MDSKYEEILKDLADTRRSIWSSSDLNYFVAQRGGITPRAAHRMINRLITINYIRKVSDGYYTLRLNKETLEQAKKRYADEYRQHLTR